MQVAENRNRSTTNPNAAVISGEVRGIKLPPLPVADIEKLDHLLHCMKARPTEPVNIYTICKEKWGDNRLLYLFFSEYLKKNYFTTVQTNTRYSEYDWKHVIAPRGLSMDGFKYEYVRQQKENAPETDEISWYRLVTSFAHYLFPFGLLIVF